MDERHDTLGLIAQQLALGLAPLRTALQDDQSFQGFMLRLGWRMDTIPPELAPLAGRVDRAIAAGAALRASDGDARSVAAVLTAVRDVYDTVAGLRQAPPGIDPAVFLAHFGERLCELLVVDQLSAAFPQARAVLRALGVIVETWVPEAGGRPAFLDVRLRLDALRDLIANPQDLPRRVLGWGTREFDFHAVAELLLEFVTGLGLTARLERVAPDIAAGYQAGAPAGTRPMAWTLKVALIEHALLGIPFVVGGALHELPAEGARPPGVVLEPLLPDNLSATTALTDSLSLRLRAGTNLAETFGVMLRDGDLQVRYPGSPAAVAPAAGLGAALVYAPATAKVWLGNPAGSRLQLGGFTVSADLDVRDGEPVLRVTAATDRFEAVLAPGDVDGFIGELLGGRQRSLSVPLRVTWSSRDGLSLAGGADLRVDLAARAALGPVEARNLVLRLAAPPTDPSAAELSLALTLAAKLGPVAVTIDGLGLRIGLQARTGNAGPFDVDAGGRPPDGVGIVVDAGPVSGGGFLFYDRNAKQYAGALQLAIGQRITLGAIGLVTTVLPDGSGGFSMVVVGSLEFSPPIVLFLGVRLHGMGALVGINRTVDPAALRAGLRNHTLDAVLFPRDVVANAPRLLSALQAVFPASRGHHLAGFTARLSFGSPALVHGELGIVYEYGARRLVAMGQLHMEIPASQKILEMHLDAVGILDLDRGEFSLDATLYDSRLAFVGFSGDVAVRMRKGDSSFFLLSAGGYHPEFAVPPGFPELRRLTISLADSKHLRLLLTGYLAITSNTRQIGASMEFYAGLGGFSIESTLTFDALWEPDVRFVAEFDVGFKLKYRGRTLLGVDVCGRFTGPAPKRVVGKWSIDLWLFSVSKSFDKTFGDDRPPAVLPAVDPLPALLTALRQPANWAAELPDGAHTLVTLRKRPGSDQVLVHPLGSLGVRQQILPLGIRLDRFAGAELRGTRTFEITAAKIGGRPAGRVTVDEQFAAGDFLELSDDERIARPSFEAMPAGVWLRVSDAIAFGNETAVSEMDFDQRIIGPDGAAPAPTPPGVVPLAVHAAAFGPAARSPLRRRGAERLAATGPRRRVVEPRFVIARVDDLGRTELAAGTSYVAAAQSLERHLSASPADRGALQVVAASTASAASAASTGPVPA